MINPESKALASAGVSAGTSRRRILQVRLGVVVATQSPWMLTRAFALGGEPTFASKRAAVLAHFEGYSLAAVDKIYGRIMLPPIVKKTIDVSNGMALVEADTVSITRSLAFTHFELLDPEGRVAARESLHSAFHLINGDFLTAGLEFHFQE